MEFRYEAIDGEGKRVTGEITADSSSGAFEILQRKGLEALTLDEKFGIGTSANSNKALPAETKVRIFKKMAVLAQAQAPLLEALNLCAKQEKHTQTKRYVEYLADSVRAGDRLSDAVKNKDLFQSKFVHALILTAEHSGNFAENFLHISQTLHAQQQNKKEIIQQLIYPIILGVFVLLTLIFISFFVLPQFEQIFQDTTADVPKFTLMVITIGQWLRKWAWSIPFICILGGSFLAFFLRNQRAMIDKGMLKLPLIGNFVRTVNAERLCRTLSGLLAGGVALDKSFDIARQVISNIALLQQFDDLVTQVKRGKLFHRAATSLEVLPEEAISLIEVGERTGRLPDMLLNAANFCREELEHRLRKFTAILGPAMTAAAGLVIAIVISAILMGILSLNESIY